MKGNTVPSGIDRMSQKIKRMSAGLFLHGSEAFLEGISFQRVSCGSGL